MAMMNKPGAEWNGSACLGAEGESNRGQDAVAAAAMGVSRQRKRRLLCPFPHACNHRRLPAHRHCPRPTRAESTATTAAADGTRTWADHQARGGRRAKRGGPETVSRQASRRRWIVLLGGGVAQFPG